MSAQTQSRCSCDELFQALMEMYSGDEVEVSGDTGAMTNDVFANPTPLATLTSLHAQTSKMLKSDWDSILCTAESGQWFLGAGISDEIEKRKARLALVVADETYSKDLRTKFGAKLGDRIRWLPWWLHNRHVTVLLSNKRVTQAIFFERRLRALHIAPLWLYGIDAEVAMDTFVAYWIKASQYDRIEKDIEISPKQVMAESERLMIDLYSIDKGSVTS